MLGGPLQRLRLFLLDRGVAQLRALVLALALLRGLARLSFGALLLQPHLVTILALADYEFGRELYESLAGRRVFGRARGVLVVHGPEVHDGRAVLLLLVVGERLQLEDVVGPQHDRLLALLAALRLLGLRVAHRCDG
jgi:hypothetical protein